MAEGSQRQGKDEDPCQPFSLSGPSLEFVGGIAFSANEQQKLIFMERHRQWEELKRQMELHRQMKDQDPSLPFSLSYPSLEYVEELKRQNEKLKRQNEELKRQNASETKEKSNMTTTSPDDVGNQYTKSTLHCLLPKPDNYDSATSAPSQPKAGPRKRKERFIPYDPTISKPGTSLPQSTTRPQKRKGITEHPYINKGRLFGKSTHALGSRAEGKVLEIEGEGYRYSTTKRLLGKRTSDLGTKPERSSTSQSEVIHSHLEVEVDDRPANTCPRRPPDVSNSTDEPKAEGKHVDIEELPSRRFPGRPHIFCPKREERMDNIRKLVDGNRWGNVEGYEFGSLIILMTFDTTEKLETFREDFSQGRVKAECCALVTKEDPKADLETVTVEFGANHKLDSIRNYLEADVLDKSIEYTFCDKTGHWYWTADKTNWQTAEKVIVQGGEFEGKKPKPDDIAQLTKTEMRNVEEHLQSPCLLCERECEHPAGTPGIQNEFFAFNGIKLYIEWNEEIEWVPMQQLNKLPMKDKPDGFEEVRHKSNEYDMTATNKGKAGIIAIHTFTSLANIPAYQQDKEDLAGLWDALGFQVLIPKRRDEEFNPTAKDMLSAVNRFADCLSGEDNCAVLTILTHGGDGFLCGTDGSAIKTTDLLHLLSNNNCKQMSGKPKVVILQACRDGPLQNRRCVSTYSDKSVPTDAPYPYLPTISDMVACNASIQGYAAYYNERSAYITALVEVFAEHAMTEDINTLLTRVNDRVASCITKDPNDKKTPPTPQKQMPEFSSSLRKLLFFFSSGQSTGSKCKGNGMNSLMKGKMIQNHYKDGTLGVIQHSPEGSDDQSKDGEVPMDIAGLRSANRNRARSNRMGREDNGQQISTVQKLGTII